MAWVISALLVVAAGFAVLRWWSPTIIGKAEVSRDSTLDTFPVVIRTDGGLLEVATVRYTKSYSVKNALVVAGVRIPFCPEEATITIVPQITYRVRLAQDWSAEYRDKRLAIAAPPLEPSLPVAFDTEHIKQQLHRCWFIMNMGTKQELLNSLSAKLANEATDASRINFARDHGATDTVREFVRKWVLSQKGYDLPSDVPIDVTFAQSPAFNKQ